VQLARKVKRHFKKVLHVLLATFKNIFKQLSLSEHFFTWVLFSFFLNITSLCRVPPMLICRFSLGKNQTLLAVIRN